MLKKALLGVAGDAGVEAATTTVENVDEPHEIIIRKVLRLRSAHFDA